MHTYYALMFLPCLIHAVQAQTRIDIADLAIEVIGNSREVSYTNKVSGVFYTETNADHRTAWQGWRIMSQEVLDDYRLELDGRALSRSDVASASVSMDQLERNYTNGISETATLLDSVNALVVQLGRMGSIGSFAVFPLFHDIQREAECIVRFSRNTLLVARKSHPYRSATANYPVWVGIRVTDNDSTVEPSSGRSAPEKFSPAGLSCRLKGTSANIIFVAGDTEEETIGLADRVAAELAPRIQSRRQRITSLLGKSYIETDNPRFDKAMQWAKASVDALIMEQGRKGIFAGLPWFDNYWGRDSFIALPGATLVTGNFADAREILRSFAQWQDTNSASTDYGRIPNLVTTTSIAYNTADGTPRFVDALDEYVRYAGDRSLARELYPAVERSIEGTLRYHCDEHYYLKHGDAETWMDAVGPNGPWSPRGDRANDIQALWYRQLRAASNLAKIVGDIKNSARWEGIADSVSKNFQTHFFVNGEVVDHLNKDGTLDHQFRPNQLFALSMVKDDSMRASLFRAITERLVYTHGVASLSQTDQNFHPFHHYAPYYVQDAAYHNGIVWPWLSGTWIEAAAELGKHDLAFTVTDAMVNQLLFRGAVGTLSELIDAAPRPGEKEPRLSGAFSQAWSLSEFIRCFYQSYLGVRLDAVARTIHFRPRLPKWMTRVRFAVAIDTSIINVEYDAFSNKGFVVLSGGAKSGAYTVDVDWMFRQGNRVGTSTTFAGGIEIKISIRDSSASVTSGGGTSQLPVRLVASPSFINNLSGLRFAIPTIRGDLKSLRGPGHPILSRREIKARPTRARAIVSVPDPENDDRGMGSYSYPLTTSLKAGSLDITKFDVKSDDQNLYFSMKFRNLSDPGWHPEYGFQLTYVAIAIDKDGRKRTGQQHVGMNSGYTMPDDLGYESIIYVGGGLRIEDSQRGIVAEYVPTPGDEVEPLGDAREKRISFAIPRHYIGKAPASWRYVVLVGGQDDHGGAGIGEFRSVGAEAKEWSGGGKSDPNHSNIYDVLVAGPGAK